MHADESCFTNGYLDTPVDWIAGMLPSARLRDLPTFIRTTDPDDTMLTINIKQCELDSPAADGILLNTFDDLECRALDAIRARLPNTFTVGPLGPEVAPPSYLPSLTSSLWRGDGRCAAWLDAHAAGSVVYVNFGSITVVTGEQMDEFAWGLAAAGACSCGWSARTWCATVPAGGRCRRGSRRRCPGVGSRWGGATRRPCWSTRRRAGS